MEHRAGRSSRPFLGRASSQRPHDPPSWRAAPRRWGEAKAWGRRHAWAPSPRCSLAPRPDETQPSVPGLGGDRKPSRSPRWGVCTRSPRNVPGQFIGISRGRLEGFPRWVAEYAPGPGRAWRIASWLRRRRRSSRRGPSMFGLIVVPDLSISSGHMSSRRLDRPRQGRRRSRTARRHVPSPRRTPRASGRANLRPQRRSRRSSLLSGPEGRRGDAAS